MLIALTPNEATIDGAVLGAVLGAVFGGIASILTTRYAIKHGANYGQQITDINKTLDTLARTQDELRQQHADATKAEVARNLAEDERAEAARWKPSARIVSNIQGSEQVNTLRLESPLSFALTEAALISPDGAKLHDYPVPGEKTFTMGFSVPLIHGSLMLLDAYGPENSKGRVKYTVLRQCDGIPYTGELSFVARKTYVGNGLWYKLQG